MSGSVCHDLLLNLGVGKEDRVKVIKNLGWTCWMSWKICFGHIGTTGWTRLGWSGPGTGTQG